MGKRVIALDPQSELRAQSGSFGLLARPEFYICTGVAVRVNGACS
jgi:hypothetical protein